MANPVVLDALISREDFEIISSGDEAPKNPSIKINELEPDAFFYGALRKPDFQRETAEWDPKRVVGLIRTFIEGELIPAVILWRNRELLFVIDGSHRLSALIAWVHDDYGDGERSQSFFGHEIPQEQKDVAQTTRELVEKEFGSYKIHREAITKPDKYGPEVVARARRFGSLALELQWVSGGSVKAEDSFVRINQQAAIITPEELELLKTRKKPATIAARAIKRRGTGHKYWYSFDEKQKQMIVDTATILHRMIFTPELKYPIKSLDLPPGGSVSAASALRMVYDFIGICIGTPSQEDDTTGGRTVEYLTQVKRVMQLVLSNDASSMGLHPGVYFYSWTGKQQPILFLTMASLLVDWDRAGKLTEFTSARKSFESFLMGNRSLLNQVIRKFGTKASGTKHLREFYEDVLGILANGIAPEAIVTQLQKKANYAYLQPAESAYEGVSPTKFSTQVKSGVVMKELLTKAHRCPICFGLVPFQAISVDHIERKQDGGSSRAKNAQVAHPYCNTGYKEHLNSKKTAKR